MVSRRMFAPLLVGLFATVLSACSGGASNVTPTPANTPTPIVRQLTPTPSRPTNEQILLGEFSSLPGYTHNETAAMMDEVKTDNPNTPEDESEITYEEVGKVDDAVKEPLFLTVAQHDGLTAELKLRNYSSVYAELRDKSYSPWLLVNLPNLTIALNAKVIADDMYEVEPDIREMKGDYAFRLHREGRILLPIGLDDETLRRYYPDEAKRRAMLINYWSVPYWNSQITTFGREHEARKTNLELAQNAEFAAERAYNDHTFNITGPSSGNMIRMSEYEWSNAAWGDWLRDRSRNGWLNTVAAFNEMDRILSSDPEFGERWGEVKFRIGYARRSHLPNWSVDLYFGHESDMINMLPATYNGVIPITHACSAPTDNLNVCEFVIGGIPQYLIDRIHSELDQHELADLGYSVSLYLPRKSMEMDGARKLVYWEPSFGRDGFAARDRIIWNSNEN